MQTPERIWLHPITEDDIQDAWFADGVPGDVEYVSAAALTEAQATIARLEAEKAALGQAVQVVCATAKAEVERITAVLQTIANGQHDRPAVEFARAALSPGTGE